VLATVSAAHTETLTTHGTPRAQALTDGYHLAFWIGVGLLAVAMAVTLAVLRPAPTPAAELERPGDPTAPPQDDESITATPMR
jgi:hypothetical protein